MPHDNTAERALLGAIILDPEQLVPVLDVLDHQDFYRPEHAHAFQLVRELAAKQVAIDVVTVVSAAMARDPKLYGGAGYLAEMPEHCVSPANATHYARTVRARSLQRQHLATLEQARALVLEADTEAEEVGQQVAALFVDSGRPRTRSVWNIHEAAVLTEQETAAAFLGEGSANETKVIPTGFWNLDECLGGGLRSGDLCVVGGRPSMGKSALATAIQCSVDELGHRVLYASAEPRRVDWVWRYAGCVTGIPIEKIRSPHLRTQAEWDLITSWSHDTTASLRAKLLFKPGLALDDIRTRARACAMTGGLDLLIVDHLHLMNHRKERGERSDQAIGRTTAGLKELAGELNCAVLLLAQLSRGSSGFGRDRRKPTGDGEWWDRIELPTPTDLRESGNIEQDADQIIFPLAGAMAFASPPPDIGDAAVLVVAKQRNGPQARLRARWDSARACYRPAYKSSNNQGAKP